MDFRDEALEMAENKCHKCGESVSLKTAMFDYRISSKNGGSSTVENISVSCPKCYLTQIDRVVGTLTNPVVESAAKLWIQSYIKYPVSTAIISILISLVATFSAYKVNEKVNLSTNDTEVSLDFKSQIKQLDETEKSLKTLLEFVNSQRETTTLNEQRIVQLETEKLELEPLVNADKATVDALFKVQEARASANASKERWFGFGLGILASIVASFVMVVGKYFFITRRENS